MVDRQNPHTKLHAILPQAIAAERFRAIWDQMSPEDRFRMVDADSNNELSKDELYERSKSMFKDAGH